MKQLHSEIVRAEQQHLRAFVDAYQDGRPMSDYRALRTYGEELLPDNFRNYAEEFRQRSKVVCGLNHPAYLNK